MCLVVVFFGCVVVFVFCFGVFYFFLAFKLAKPLPWVDCIMCLSVLITVLDVYRRSRAIWRSYHFELYMLLILLILCLVRIVMACSRS